MKPPYRLQIFLPEPVREALKDLAHEERQTLQGLVVTWLLEKIHTYPRYRTLEVEEEG